ncbi:MAG: hypothetical protein E7E83_22340, partial [Enterobacter ludwigii]|nr:hypothetical protein [Enterobacter ludwigii]
CSGASGTATTRDYRLNDGRGVALLKCKTDAQGYLWVNMSGVYGRTYQASTDGAVGELNEMPMIGVSAKVEGPVSAPGFLTGAVTSPSRSELLAKLNSGGALDSCKGSYSGKPHVVDSTCMLGTQASGQYISPRQAQGVVTCTTTVNGQNNPRLNWDTPVAASKFGVVGAALAEARTASIQLACSGPGVGELKTISLGARGEVSLANNVLFASSNESVDYKVVVSHSNKSIAPNTVTNLTSADGVAYTPTGADTRGTVDLAVTPVAARATAIPGRADARIILDIYAGL